MTPFLALHWPQQTIVATDRPDDGWAMARLLAAHRFTHLPIADQAAVAVTYQLPSMPHPAERVPLDHQRVRRALRLAEQYTLGGSDG